MEVLAFCGFLVAQKMPHLVRHLRGIFCAAFIEKSYFPIGCAIDIVSYFPIG